MPTVSVIITTHDRPDRLPRAVASAFGAGSDPEVVVVDDASADETARVCRALALARAPVPRASAGLE
jgi:glycosyltransferase involved in cell wall biosynthesis